MGGEERHRRHRRQRRHPRHQHHRGRRGIGLAREIATAMAMRAILDSFGGSAQDEAGKPVLNSKNTVEAVKFVKALFQETMSPEVFSWDASSNNRAILSGRASVVLNAIS